LNEQALEARAPLVLAFLSGAPALVYQVVWTRETALLAGSQIEAISAVLVAFFAGLALGARGLGPRADRARRPLRLYGALEIAAGLLAAGSIPLLRALGELGWPPPATLALASAAVFAPTWALGGTLPALLRGALGAGQPAARCAGLLLAANTAGSVAGVALAVWLVPGLGLRATAWLAAGLSIGVGLAALLLGGRGAAPAQTSAEPPPRALARSGPALAAAALAGVATLAYEVLAARMAMLRLGSSLLAWGAVLVLYLIGLAAGNAAFARRAAASASPARELGWVEVAAAAAIALGLAAIAPPIGTGALGPGELLAVALAALPPAFLMGGAFPYFVRLAAGGARVGAEFGRVSACNTAGGIAGALLAPFALIPAFGLVGAGLACAGLLAALGAALVGLGSPAGPGRWLRPGLVLGAAAAVALVPAPRPATSAHVLYLAHDRQASVAVLGSGDRRDLVVDGDPEASTAGDARATEELLARLPLLLHPRPRSFLELGLGSGITLGAAARFPLDRIDCVEIAPAVLGAAALFAPENANVLERDGVRIELGDARVFLLRRRRSYDVVVANTVHPWSVGATGLYSREYFERLAGALRPGGIAAQWVPTERIDAASVAAILRTFFAVFGEGGLWWGAGNLIALGSEAPLGEPEPAGAAGELLGRRIASAAALRAALGPGEILRDDRPALERRAALGREAAGGVPELLVQIARAGVREDGRTAPLLLWFESLAAREAGEADRADGREALAAEQGFAPARRAAARRLVARGYEALAAGRAGEALAAFDAALARDPDDREARLGRAGIALGAGRLAEGADELRALLDRHPHDARARNELAVALHRLGDREGARRAVEAALASNPFYPEALANAGLFALERGDRAAARGLLARLRALAPLGPSREERALADALAEGGP